MKRNNITEILREERNTLSHVIREADKRLEKAPEGKVRIAKHGKGVQFYLRRQGKDHSGSYIRAAEREKAYSLIQKDYDLSVIRLATEQAGVIDRFLKKYDPDMLKKLHSSLSEVRKMHINAFELSDDDYIDQWRSYEYVKKPFAEEMPQHFTNNGERVRSKSEVMIADSLRQADIPYRYECPLKLRNMIIHPDFTILRISDRAELYWEHLGMMDDPDYCYRALLRIRQYEDHGIYPGINLILTMETAQIPINVAVIRNMITTYCR
ncbi:MAG: hypothetical protein J6D53_02420 [Blautia sp.]|nr:hypothetical protein [Blautia sp.]